MNIAGTLTQKKQKTKTKHTQKNLKKNTTGWNLEKKAKRQF